MLNFIRSTLAFFCPQEPARLGAFFCCETAGQPPFGTKCPEGGGWYSPEVRMAKLKTIVFVAGVMLLILAAAVGYLSIKYLAAILPADSYEDKGVYTFSPYQVLPVQVQNTGASGRNRRMNPTKTAYMVYYRDTSGSGYQWSQQALTRELGQEIVDAGAAVERRVLSVPADRSYITVEPGQTAESYTAGLRQKYITALVLAGAYVILYGAAWCVVVWLRKRKGIMT